VLLKTQPLVDFQARDLEYFLHLGSFLPVSLTAESRKKSGNAFAKASGIPEF
jgi:hypothetical protein